MEKKIRDGSMAIGLRSRAEDTRAQTEGREDEAEQNNEDFEANFPDAVV